MSDGGFLHAQCDVTGGKWEISMFLRLLKYSKNIYGEKQKLCDCWVIPTSRSSDRLGSIDYGGKIVMEKRHNCLKGWE